jgi:DeoR/GlpR family transcriptional regulator of sugar metabolism
VLASERQEAIMSRVRDSGTVRVSTLTEELGVSDMTIRRDLNQLARQGLVNKVHGGARLADGSSMHEPGFEVKRTLQRAEKQAIAREAASLVRPGYAVGLSAGTTTWTLAFELLQLPDLTVVTNSVQVAGVFYARPRPDRTVILTGGVRTPSDALVGQVAVSSLRMLNLDLVFLGAHGMDDRAGYTSPNLLESETNRAFVQSAQQLVVVADHTKWGLVGVATIAELDRADVLVSDTELSAQARDVLFEKVPDLRLASPTC